MLEGKYNYESIYKTSKLLVSHLKEMPLLDVIPYIITIKEWKNKTRNWKKQHKIYLPDSILLIVKLL